MNQQIIDCLQLLYGEERALKVAQEIGRIIHRLLPRLSDETASFFDQRDAILITYGDMVQQKGEAPLETLANFLEPRLNGIINTVHILPFFPYSSDDGFAVIDFYAVNPELGDWDDIRRLSQQFRLMFDAVINHVSSRNEWFQRFLAGEDLFNDYFISIEPGTDLSAVFRPRDLPLLTAFSGAAGEELIWTTFSEDQVDLNFAEPAVLLAAIDVLFTYIANGASLIRLDAVAFVWKEIGTTCIHLPQTHAIIRLLRALMEQFAPHGKLITETNVPHEDNISYFGNGYDEAQMVYNFSLPPLTLHAFSVGDATALSSWAQQLETPSDQTTFFNFLASHDGVGVTPLRGILDEAEIDDLCRMVRAAGGHVSYKSNADGQPSPYELNVNYLDALGAGRDDSAEICARRFLTSQAIMLALPGVPGIYFHSLFGSRNWQEGVDLTGRKRTINREKLDRARVEMELSEPGAMRQLVFSGFKRMLQSRSAESAFHPNAPHQILRLHPTLFTVLRGPVLCIHNVSDEELKVKLPPRFSAESDSATDIISGTQLSTVDPLTISAYQTVWLKT